MLDLIDKGETKCMNRKKKKVPKDATNLLLSNHEPYCCCLDLQHPSHNWALLLFAVRPRADSVGTFLNTFLSYAAAEANRGSPSE